MTLKIFFSWQVDTPAREGRNFILRALKSALESIAVDIDVEEALRNIEIDRDTLDVPGTPPIVDTIFSKIDNASIFVPDLTFVGRRIDGRPTPNPNVLIEYGWALKKLGHSCMLPVMNTAFGSPEGDAMPFDMRHLRHPIQYECKDSAAEEERTAARNKLAASMKLAITSILSAQQLRLDAPKAPPVAFQARTPLDGFGKFRSKGEPLGVSDSFMAKSQDVHDVGGPAHWLRVMPENNQGKELSISEIKRQAFMGSVLVPISATSSGHINLAQVRAEDGIGLYASLYENRLTTQWVVFVFKTGEIWSYDSYMIDAAGEQEPKSIFLNRNDLARNLHDYAERLVKLGVDQPLRWEIGLERIKGRTIYLPDDRYGRPRGHCVADQVVAGGTYFLDDDAEASIEPFFVKLYDMFGF